MHSHTEALLAHFTFAHLPEHLQEISQPICALAHEMAAKLEGPELTVGLRKLLEAKDALVRAKVEQGS